MTNMIKVTDLKDDCIYVNANKILVIEESSNGGSRLLINCSPGESQYKRDNVIYCRENPEEVITKINESTDTFYKVLYELFAN